MTEATDPGWYPDPTATGRQRYWDGSSWTMEVRDGEPEAAERVTAVVATPARRRLPRWVVPWIAGLATGVAGTSAVFLTYPGFSVDPAPKTVALAPSPESSPSPSVVVSVPASPVASPTLTYTVEQQGLIEGLGLDPNDEATGEVVRDVDSWCTKATELSAAELFTQLSAATAEQRSRLLWSYENYCANQSAGQLVAAVGTSGAWVDGDWGVATTEGKIPPGTYRTVTGVEGCSWTRYNAWDDAVEEANSIVSSTGTELTLIPRDERVVTADCGVWIPVNA